MDIEYMNCFLIETPDGAQGIVWADDIHQAEDMAAAEMEDADRDSSVVTVRPLPNHNLIFGED